MLKHSHYLNTDVIRVDIKKRIERSQDGCVVEMVDVQEMFLCACARLQHKTSHCSFPIFVLVLLSAVRYTAIHNSAFPKPSRCKKNGNVAEGSGRQK